jgi:hypothetical protein
MYKVVVRKRVLKGLSSLPGKERMKLKALIRDIELEGPIQPGWSNFSKLSEGKYHCHLSYHWVACWSSCNDDLEVEVYYAGSRENAPY